MVVSMSTYMSTSVYIYVYMCMPVYMSKAMVYLSVLRRVT